MNIALLILFIVLGVIAAAIVILIIWKSIAGISNFNTSFKLA